jgi:phosphoglycerate kinase
MTIISMTDLDLANKRVLIREDLNVPIKQGEITSDLRIRAALPTIKAALDAKAAVIVLSHLGRPTEGGFDDDLSLAPVAKRLGELLGQEVTLISNWIDGLEVSPGQVVLCENVRFQRGEKANDPELSKKMAALCDVYVMDAFATAHRSESSTCGVAEFAPIACAGPLLMNELNALGQAFESPAHPVVAIVGGSKVSTKVKVLDALAKKVDTLIVGGGIANTFIAAQGHEVGGSLYEKDFIDEAERLLEEAKAAGKGMPMPVDVVVGDKFSDDAHAYTQPVADVESNEKIFDVGPETAKQFADIIEQAKTVLWNGPVGAFEIELYSKGTEVVAKAIANSKAFSVAGGGDTLAAIEKYGVADQISYISTGGGAFLAYLEGNELPAVKALEARGK